MTPNPRAAPGAAHAFAPAVATVGEDSTVRPGSVVLITSVGNLVTYVKAEEVVELDEATTGGLLSVEDASRDGTSPDVIS